MRPPALFSLSLAAALTGSALLLPEPSPRARLDNASMPRAHPEPKPAGGASARGILIPGPVPAEVLGVIDGDTVEVAVRIWIDQETRVRVRLRGIDAPELSSACDEERDHARAAQRALDRFIGQGPVHLTDIGRDKYAGRVVARIVSSAGEDVGQRLLDEGFAIHYAGGRRQPWCDLRVTAQR
jgi:endonuclease YncB( thermonuclease family)